MKIVSGGQTGVDRGALDAALSEGISCGGWCPEGRQAEDGIISKTYPLQELIGGGYLQRTHQNVIDSNGTLIIYFSYLSSGTEDTLRFCLVEKSPYLLIDAEEIPIERAAQRLYEFSKILGQEVTLNIAGPRGSMHKNAYGYSYKIMSLFFQMIEANDC
jgi:hypothetical protein